MTKEEQESFKQAALPLIKWLCENVHPHHTAIVTGTATGTVPALRIAFPDHIGSLDTSSMGSTTIDFQGAMNTGSAFLSGSMNDEGDTLWGTFMPFWQLFCYGMLTVAIIYDLLGLREKQHRVAHKKEIPV